MKVSEEIIKVLDALCEKFGIAIDWTQKNVLPYVESLCAKLITWEIATSIFWICLMPLITLIIFFVAKKATKKYKEEEQADGYFEDDWFTGMIVGWVFFAIAALISIIVIGTQMYDIVTCLTFPEMVIFNQIQPLISSGN